MTCKQKNGYGYSQDTNKDMPLGTIEKSKILQFFITFFEQLWMERNKIWKSGKKTEWIEISTLMNRLYLQYWRLVRGRRQCRSNLPSTLNTDRWIPPLKGEFKLNFDATFMLEKIATRIVLRDSEGAIVGAWVNHFNLDNPFCAEAEATTQALKIAAQLQLQTVTMEGDAQTVILTMQGISQFLD